MDDLPEGYLREDRALAVLEAYGFPVPPYRLCRDANEAVSFAHKIGYPVVLRVVSPQVVHKYDVKGVALNLADARSVRKAFKDIVNAVEGALPGAEIAGIIVRRMIPSGHEVILGAKRDAVFGPTVMFGLGGLFVEVLKDVTFALAPMDAAAAGRMVRGVKAYALLEGVRGQPRADIAGIEQCLLRLSQLVTDFPRIQEMDVNPLIVGAPQTGCAVADVRIRLSR
jgi:acyl-CoA synthetase (NDP forming)